MAKSSGGNEVLRSVTKRTHTFTVGRHEITMQDLGTRWAMDAEERCQHPMSGRIMLVPMAEELLEHAVITPRGLTIDDFDHEDELIEMYRQWKTFRRKGPARTGTGREPEKVEEPTA